MKSKCLSIGILIILSIPVLAQKDTAKSPTPINIGRKGELIMNLGAGLSTINLLLNGFIGGSGPDITSETPVINSALDYYVINRLSLGLGVAFQEITDIPLNGDIPLNSTEYITRTNVAFRMLAHLGKNPDIDYYLGVRIGVSFWSDYESPDVGHYSARWGPLYPPPAQSMRESLQILFGLRFNASEVLGIHIETGIGTPYFLEGGISVMILKSKGNK